MEKARKKYCCNALIMGVAVFACSIFTYSSALAEELTESTPGIVQPMESQTPESTPQITATPEVVTPSPTPVIVTPKPTPHVKRLEKVKGIKIRRYSTNVVKVSWKKKRQANYYHVFCEMTKNGKARLVGTTQQDHFLVKKLKNKKEYTFYVTAGKTKKFATSDSMPSQKKKMTMKKYQRKVVFAGDSICEGIAYEGGFPAMHLGAKKKVVAYRGLNTVTFHTKRIFNGRTGLQKLIAENPYRVYMMLGMNEIHYRPVSQMISEYKDMIEAIRQADPNTDIVLCAISPVTRAEKARHSGMKQIPVFNQKLKKLAKKMGLKYLDYTDFLKDSGGFLKAAYATGDGYHWKPSAYAKFGKVITKYDKSLD
ncbi:MAG: GDSL-type esterase/lipase family protein [Eubacterium sp.]